MNSIPLVLNREHLFSSTLQKNCLKIVGATHYTVFPNEMNVASEKNDKKRRKRVVL